MFLNYFFLIPSADIIEISSLIVLIISALFERFYS